MPKYMLLLHESPTDFDGLSPEEIQQIIQKYSDWRRRLEQEGRFVSGQKLRRGGRVLRRDAAGGTSVTDGPYGEAKEVLGGAFVIQADSYEQAAELAQGGPHLGRGAVEVREIEFE